VGAQENDNSIINVPAPRQKYVPCISVHIIHCMCIRTLGLGSVKVNVAIICRCTTWMCSILVMVNEWSIGFYWWHWLDVPFWICVFIHPNAITITISWTISQFRETHIKHMYEKRFGPPLGCVLRLNALGVVGKFCWVPLGKYTFPHLPIQSTKLLGNDWNPPNQLPWCFWFQTLCYLHHIS